MRSDVGCTFHARAIVDLISFGNPDEDRRSEDPTLRIDSRRWTL